MMENWAIDGAVTRAVRGAVHANAYQIVCTDATRAMFWKVTLARGLAVYVAVYQALTRALPEKGVSFPKWAVVPVIEEGRSPPHPGLGLYLDAEAECRARP